MKDNFSLQSTHYAQFRPGYPPQMFKNCPTFDQTSDGATGNGQIAVLLAERLK